MAEHVDLEMMKILREKVNWEVETKRREFLRRLRPLIENWKGQLPNLWKMFRSEEIKRLIADSAKGILFDKDYNRVDEYQRFIEFVIRAGYDKGGLKFNEVILLHHLANLYYINGDLYLDDPKVSRCLFDIYAQFDVHYFDKESRSEHFHMACEFVSYHVVKKFLELGQDPNCFHRETGESPLHLLASSTRDNDNEVRRTIELLLRNGANPNAANRMGSTPLHNMCRFRQPEYVGTIERFLSVCDEVRQRVNIDAQDNEGRTPLHLALKHDRQEVVLLLLRRGADPNARDAEGTPPLHLVVRAQSHLVRTFFEICDEMQRTVRVNAQDTRGDTPLHLTLPWGDKEVFKTLLRRGADPNLANQYGTTPLHAVCCRDRDDGFVQILFEICDEMQLTVQIDARDKSGKTPLQLAMENLLPNTVDVLLNRGADMSNCIFPTSIGTEVRLNSPLTCKMRVASGALAVAEQLEARGYSFSQSDALTIMKFFARHDLFEKSSDLEKSLRDDEEFTKQAKKAMIIPSLSLYDLIHLGPEEEEKLLTYRDYFVFAGQLSSGHYKLMIPERHNKNCLLHLCEKLSRGFFRRWALDPFYELIHKRLPILCCEQILEKLDNQDLCNICLAFADQASYEARSECVVSTGYVDKIMAHKGEHELVQVDERDNLGNTPLHLAIKCGDKDSMKLLLSNGANANWPNKNGYTPLHHICMRKSDDGLAKIFFECNDEINQPLQIDAQNKLDQTPLHLALRVRNTSAAELLLRRGADPNLVDWLKYTPLHIISKNCYSDDFIELFFNISEEKHRLLHVNVQDYEGNTPLHLALYHGQLKLVELLLKRGNDPNIPNTNGFTPLNMMCLSDHVNCDSMKMFFEICKEKNLQVQVDTAGNWGWTPLHWALLKRGREEMIELLLRNGANPNMVNKEGLTPLHVICTNYYYHEFCEIFFNICEELNQLVQVNAQDELGNTPLHLTLKHKYMKQAELLLKKGADPSIANAEGSTPLHIFCNRRHDKNAFMIDLFFAVNEVQVDARDKEGRTPLHYAVTNLSSYVVDALLNHGADASSFVFPTASQFIERFNEPTENSDYLKLEIRSCVLYVTERLEEKGYQLDRDATITIIKLFANNKLCDNWLDLDESGDEYCLDEPYFTSQAKEIMIISDLSLYDLIQLRQKEAEKRLTYADYLKLARSDKLKTLPEIYSSLCIERVCEKLSRGLFRRWALDSFSKLIHNRLPILCCDTIMDHLENKDLWSIYLANCDLSEAERNDPLIVWLLTLHCDMINMILNL
ncbi:ankyrin-1-like [Trichogramma pretiosum]|uniref:ankyrin-1-like n=1 Tax=Trichogramma pretiosum TaxID=7493 RepID=UPI000C71AFAE|nr:ankyrin-1-like [Trichogramma pretiosum]